jgi:uncharacterized membrane protein YccC
MWTAVAIVFVFKETRARGLAAGIARLSATLVSFALCFLYLSLLPPSAVGAAVLIGLGTLAMILLDRQEDIATTGITTAVVMVVAIMHPGDARQQPIMRLIDTIIGIAVGVAANGRPHFCFIERLERSHDDAQCHRD